MRIYRIVFVIFITQLITACIYQHIPDSNDQKNTKIISPEQKAELSIRNYVEDHYKNIGSYTSYSFGQLYSLKPKEIVELDQLILVRKKLPEMSDNYGSKLDSVLIATDTLIARKKREIRLKKIHHTYEINHMFTIKPEKGSLKLYEFTFFLYPNYKVKDVSQKLNTELNAEETDLFVYFIEQYPLIENDNDDFAANENKRTYEMLTNAVLDAGDQKEKIIHQVLRIVKHIRKNNVFDPDLFCATLVKEWISEHETYKNNYRPALFTRLKESNANNSERASSNLMYHKFKYQPKSSSMTEVVISFEFDPNYLPIEIIEYQKEYDKFFK